jgi:transposase
MWKLARYLEARNAQVSAKSKLGEAIRYALIRWDGLSRFIGDGRIDLDSNTVERSIRPLALNRKNALFAGSDEGGDNWAVIATLIECCKLSTINPHQWLTETLARLANGHPPNRVGELMPWTAVGWDHRLRKTHRATRMTVRRWQPGLLSIEPYL